MDEKIWRVRCRFPGCEWAKTGTGDFVAIDERLSRHMIEAHTHRELVEALVSTWHAKADDVAPISVVDVGEESLLDQIQDLRMKLDAKERALFDVSKANEKLRAKLSRRQAKEAKSPPPDRAPLGSDGGLREEQAPALDAPGPDASSTGAADGATSLQVP